MKAYAFVLDLAALAAVVALRLVDKIDNELVFLVVGSIVGANASQRAAARGSGGGASTGAVASIVFAVAAMAASIGRRGVATLALLAILALGSVSCAAIPGAQRNMIAAALRYVADLAEAVCTELDSPEACLRKCAAVMQEEGAP